MTVSGGNDDPPNLHALVLYLCQNYSRLLDEENNTDFQSPNVKFHWHTNRPQVPLQCSSSLWIAIILYHVWMADQNSHRDIVAFISRINQTSLYASFLLSKSICRKVSDNQQHHYYEDAGEECFHLPSISHLCRHLRCSYESSATKTYSSHAVS